jgi:ubiquinone/menaquinone biosynthesis C-methylase UbiE
MVDFSVAPLQKIKSGGKEIASFISNNEANIDWNTVKSFGEEWEKFAAFSEAEINAVGDEYFDIAGNEVLNKNSVVLDVGCGSGRWSLYVASRAAFVEAIDPSNAVHQANALTAVCKNVRVSQASVDAIPFPDESFDLVFSLGVLHHIPDTQQGIRQCVKKVKKGGHFLIYLYYSLDQRGFLYRLLFHLSNVLRHLICRLPGQLKRFVCDVLAVLCYMPFVWISQLLSKTFLKSYVRYIPLSYYRDKSFNIIRNDSLDRFGTPLEKRFSKAEIQSMLEECGLQEITFSSREPYWHACGKKING